VLMIIRNCSRIRGSYSPLPNRPLRSGSDHRAGCQHARRIMIGKHFRTHLLTANAMGCLTPIQTAGTAA